MEWWQVAMTIIGIPAAWETLRWLLGFGRRNEYFTASEAAHVRDLERLDKKLDKADAEIKEAAESRKALIKENLQQEGELIKAAIRVAQLEAQLARKESDGDSSPAEDAPSDRG
jgi:hypothetical protein